MKNWLNTPFPLIDTTKQKFWISLVFGSFIFLFLIIFQPFGISNIHENKISYLAGFLVITFLVMFLNSMILPLILKKIFNPDNWTILKNILSFLWGILQISIFNWLYNSYVSKGFTEQDNLLTNIFETISVGIFPVVLFTIYAEKILTKKHNLIAIQLTNTLVKNESIYTDNKNKIELELSKNTKIKFVSENNKELVDINFKDFFCIRSEGNYVNVFYFENNKIKNQLLRNSLTNIMEQYKDFEAIVRCHRYFIVNLKNVKKITGNARNYNLHLENLDFTIPVSRNFPKEIIENFTN